MDILNKLFDEFMSIYLILTQKYIVLILHTRININYGYNFYGDKIHLKLNKK